jgi:DNA primase
MDYESVKDEIKRRLKLEDIVSQHVALQRAGSRLRARCPFHQEKTPSFYVNPQLGLWKCFGCGAGGDIFEFVMKIEGLTFTEAGERLAERAGLQWRVEPGEEARAKRRDQIRRANELAADYFQGLLTLPAGREGLDYLRKRQFSHETIARFRLGFAPDAWDGLLRHLRQQGIDEAVAAEAGLARERAGGGHYDVFRRRVIFPIIDVSNRVIGFGGRALDPEDPAKYLNTADTPMFKKGRNVYALNLARAAIMRTKSVVLVEGYTDVISLHQAGAENVVACLGTALTQDHLNLLSRYAEEIVLAYDADAAGMNAAARNIPMLEACSAEVRIVVLPAGLDPDDLVKQQGAEGFQRALANRSSPVEYEVNLQFSRHAERGADGLARAAQEVVAILLRVPDRTRRDEYLHRAADRWGMGNPGRTLAMERSLREELLRREGEQHPGPRFRPDSPRDRRFVTQTVARLSDEDLGGIRRAERQLLAAALDDPGRAGRLVYDLTPMSFLHEHQELAAAVAAVVAEDPAPTAQGIMARLPEGSPEHALALELAMAPLPTLEEELQTAAENIRAYHQFGKYRGRYVVPPDDEAPEQPQVEDFEELRKRVSEKLSSGTLDPEDPDIVLYKSLATRLHGKGRLEYVGGESAVTPAAGTGPHPNPPEALKTVLPDQPETSSDEGS